MGGGPAWPTTTRIVNVRRCAEGVARYVADRGEQAKGVVVAYDRRFASEDFAKAAAEVLLAYDIPVAFAERAVPTQMASYEVVERGAAAGVVITASHNPWTDNGFKVKAASGAAAGPEILAALEAVIATNGDTEIPSRPFVDAQAAGLVELFDPYPGYETFLRRTLDLDFLRAADAHILVDPLYGSGLGLDPAPPGRRRRSASPRSTASETRTSAASTRSRSGPTWTRRSRGSRRAASTSGSCSMATRTGPVRSTSGASSFTSSRCTGSSCTTSWSTAG